MKKTIRFCLCILTLCLALSHPLTAAAAALDVQEPCSLTLHYTKNGAAFGGLEIEIFRIAAFESDGSYTLTGDFSTYPVKIHNMQSQKEWQESTQALVAYVEADALSPTAAGITDASGTVVFDDLSTGLYLVMGADARTETGSFRFQPFCVFLPTPNADGGYDYRITASPKPGAVTPISRYQVVKLWKDSANRQNRPTSITVEILKDGVLHETVVLNAGNNWSYAWETTDVDSRWSVMEQNVPAGYTVSISSRDGVFTITNESSKGSEKPPQSGDSSMLWHYAAAMCVSGLALVILSSRLKRKTA